MERLGIVVGARSRDIMLSRVSLDLHIKLSLFDSSFAGVHSNHCMNIRIHVLAWSRISGIRVHVRRVDDRFIKIFSAGSEGECLLWLEQLPRIVFSLVC